MLSSCRSTGQYDLIISCHSADNAQEKLEYLLTRQGILCILVANLIVLLPMAWQRTRTPNLKLPCSSAFKPALFDKLPLVLLGGCLNVGITFGFFC